VTTETSLFVTKRRLLLLPYMKRQCSFCWSESDPHTRAREQTSSTYTAAPCNCPQPLSEEGPAQTDYRNHPSFSITSPNIQEDHSQLNHSKALPNPRPSWTPSEILCIFSGLSANTMKSLVLLLNRLVFLLCM